MHYSYTDYFHLATINMELLLYPLHLFAHFGLPLHYSMKHDSTNPSTLKKGRKYWRKQKQKKYLKQCLFLGVNFSIPKLYLENFCGDFL